MKAMFSPLSCIIFSWFISKKNTYYAVYGHLRKWGGGSSLCTQKECIFSKRKLRHVERYKMKKIKILQVPHNYAWQTIWNLCLCMYNVHRKKHLLFTENVKKGVFITPFLTFHKLNEVNEPLNFQKLVVMWARQFLKSQMLKLFCRHCRCFPLSATTATHRLSVFVKA